MPDSGWELRNLARRGPEWLGERDLRVCRSPQPFLAAHAPHRRTSGPRTRLSPHRYVFPRARFHPFARLASQGWEKRVGGLLGSGSCSEARGRVCARGQRRMRERPRTDACAEQRRAHPQTVPCACGEPAELTVTEATRGCLPWSAGASRSLSWIRSLLMRLPPGLAAAPAAGSVATW